MTTTLAPASETSGGADEDEGSDREEEAVAPIDDNSEELAPPKEKPMQLSPCDDDEDIGPIPQIDGDIEDTDMTSGLPEVHMQRTNRSYVD